MRLWLLLLCVLIGALPAQAATLVNEDFEVANLSALSTHGWTGITPGSPVTSAIATTTGHTGASTNVLRMTYDCDGTATQDTCAALGSNAPGANSSISRYLHTDQRLEEEIWERWWVRYTKIRSANTAGWLSSTMVGAKQHYWNSSTTDPVFFSWSGFVLKDGNKFMMEVGRHTFSVLCPSGNTGPTCFYLANVQATTMSVDGIWHCIEVHQKVNAVGSANGLTETYIDGTLTGRWDNVEMRNSTASGFRHIRLYRQGGFNHTRDEDDYRVDSGSTRIGCGGSPPPPVDTTPPSQVGVPTVSASGNSATITWPAATDNVGVTGYSAERCAGASCTPAPLTSIGNVLTYTDTTIAPGIIYGYRMRARDAAGNQGPLSAIVYATSLTTFPSVLAQDAFTRADNANIGAAWDGGYTAQTTYTLTSNQLRSTTVNTRSLESYNAISTPDSQWSQSTIKTFTGAQVTDQCVGARMANAATFTGYFFCAMRNSANTFEIREYTAGTLTTIHAGNATYTPAVGDKYKLDAEGTTLRGWLIRGTATILVASATDASIASGKCGLSNFVATGGSAANNEQDDFACGGFGSSTQETIAVDAVSSSATGNTTNSITWSHTVGTGTNRVLAVCTQGRDTSEADLVTTNVTYGGVPLTKVREDVLNSGTSDFGTSLWRLTAPTSGTANVVITWTGALSAYGVGSGVSYTGVDQVAPGDASGGGTGTGTTASHSITTVADNAFITDCAAAQGSALTVGAGQTSQVNRETTGPSVDSVGVSTFTKTPAGAKTMSWTQAESQNWAHTSMSLKPADITPVVEPALTGMTLDATGETLTYNATTPTWIRVFEFTNTGQASRSTLHPIADFVAGRLTQTWLAGYDGVCNYPVNSLGVENPDPNASRCLPLTGIVAAADTTPIVMTQQLPTGTLNQGTTTTTFSVNLDKSATSARWATTNIAYDAMVNEMSIASLTASASSGAILSDGTTTHLFVHSMFINTLGVEVPTTTALDVSISVASGAPTDTTAPALVGDGGLAATPISQGQVQLTWTAMTDAVGVTGYQVYSDVTGACTGYVAAGLPVTTTTTVVNLPPATSISFTVKGLDAAGNISAATNCQTVTTTSPTDIEVPSTMTNLRATPFTAGAFLEWNQGTDNSGSVSTTIEISAAGCGAFTQVFANIALSHFAPSLAAGTAYCGRGFHSDNAGNRGGYSNVVEFTTATTGLPQPRVSLPFGVERDAATRDASGARTPRP